MKMSWWSFGCTHTISHSHIKGHTEVKEWWTQSQHGQRSHCGCMVGIRQAKRERYQGVGVKYYLISYFIIFALLYFGTIFFFFFQVFLRRHYLSSLFKEPGSGWEALVCLDMLVVPVSNNNEEFHSWSAVQLAKTGTIYYFLPAL